MPWLLLFCGLLPVPQGQHTPLPRDAQTLLLALRSQIIQQLHQLPKYVCTETVDRSTFIATPRPLTQSCLHEKLPSETSAPEKMRRDTSDRLRLDVAASPTGEMYSWVGANRFEDRSLASLVGHGATTTGTFFSFLSDLFETEDARFDYQGEVGGGDHALLEFRYQFPVEKSHYSVAAGPKHAIVGYDGTFLVDPATLHLVRLVIHADQLPSDFDYVCEVHTTLEYGSSLPVNQAALLLPRDTQLQFRRSDGKEFQNHTVFSGCHEFVGHSTLQFGPTSETRQGENRTAMPQRVMVPPGVSFTLVLTEPINTETAAAGDPIQAKLVNAITEAGQGVIIPKGATLTGRILDIEHQYAETSQSLRVGIALETMEAGGLSQPFNAIVNSLARRHSKRENVLEAGSHLGTFQEMDQAARGLLQFGNVNSHYVLKRGLEMTAITVATK